MTHASPAVRTATVAALIGAAALSRLLPHPPNFTPVAAMALFAGACLSSGGLALAVPLTAMFAGDLVIGLHDQMPAVYLSFALTVGLGRLLRRRRRPVFVATAALLASLQFFVLSNLGVFVTGSLYPRTLEGLAACFVQALPFLRNTLLGDALSTAALFGGFAFLERNVPILAREGAETR